MEDTLKQYLLKKLHTMESGKGERVTIEEYHDSMMDDIRGALIDLNEAGIVEMEIVPSDYKAMKLHLNPENALE